MFDTKLSLHEIRLNVLQSCSLIEISYNTSIKNMQPDFKKSLSSKYNTDTTMDLEWNNESKKKIIQISFNFKSYTGLGKKRIFLCLIKIFFRN